MRRRPLVTIALCVVSVGLGGFVALSQHVGDVGARRSSSEAASVHRVPRHEATLVAKPSIATLARGVLSPAIIAPAPAVSFSALWIALGGILFVLAGSLVRPTCRRRAPPPFVI